VHTDVLIFSASLALVVPVLVWLAIRWWKRSRQTGEHSASAHLPSVAKAEALRHNHQIKEALDLLRQAERSHPDSSIVHYRLACYYSLQKDLARARIHLKRACVLDRQWTALAMYDPDLRNLWRAYDMVQALNPTASSTIETSRPTGMG
jgi:hypothetical protein